MLSPNSLAIAPVSTSASASVSQPLSRPLAPSIAAPGLGLLRRSAGAIAATLATTAAAVTLAAIAALPAQAQEVLRTISVSGEGRIAIDATEAQVQLGVETRGASADAAQAAVARQADSLVTYLRGQSVQRLQTSSISLQPIFDQNGQEITGYIARNSVSFQVPVARAGAIIDNAVRAGATRIDSLQTLASESAVESARSRALAAAAQDARNQANVVLESLGLTPREIIQINVAGAALPPPVFAENVRAMADSKVSSPVEGGEQIVQANVTLQIRY